jgi:hypothetical protein
LGERPRIVVADNGHKLALVLKLLEVSRLIRRHYFREDVLGPKLTGRTRVEFPFAGASD